MKSWMLPLALFLTFTATAQSFKGGSTGRTENYTTFSIDNLVGKFYALKDDSRYRVKCYINCLLVTDEGDEIWVIADDDLSAEDLHGQRVRITGTYYEYPSREERGDQTMESGIKVMFNGGLVDFNPCQEHAILLKSIQAE